MPSRPPLLLYSVNTTLAYMIAEQCYESKHHVWCSPHFGQRPGPVAQPPSSSPLALYGALVNAIGASDTHDAKIRDNRAGLLRGANRKFGAGVISAEERDQIVEMVRLAQLNDFLPLVYVIPFDRVAPLAQKVPPGERASVGSEEYIIKALPRSSFDVIRLEP